MKIIDINWNPNEKATIEYILEYITESEADNLFHIPNYANMDDEERRDALCDLFRHQPAKLDEFWKLPSEVDIPKTFTIENADEFGWEWLESEYGTAVSGFRIELNDGTTITKGEQGE